MSSNAEKLYKLIANDSKKKQSLFMTALTNPKKALDKICYIGKELNPFLQILIIRKLSLKTSSSLD